MYVAMRAGPTPPQGPGRLFRGADDEPAYCRVLHATDRPDLGLSPEGATTWVGELRWPTDEVAPLTPPDCGGLLVFAQEPRVGDEEEFDAWMDTEHLPRLAGVSGTLLAQRYEAVEGTPRFAAVYYLAEPGVCSSDEWRAASRTPWRDRMSARNRGRRRWLLEPVEE